MRWILACLLLRQVAGQLLPLRPTPCLGPGETGAGPTDALLDFTVAYAQLDVGQSYPGEYATGYAYSTRPPLTDSNGYVVGGVGSVLRFVLVGRTGSIGEGFSNSTPFLSTVVQNSEFLTFPLDANQSALCLSIAPTDAELAARAPGATTLGNCPYGPGEVALGVSIPLSDPYILSTLHANLVVLDSSVPALKLACYNLDFTPYYPNYFAYSLFHYAPIGLLGGFFLLYIIARGWSAHTSFIQEHETLLASSLTLKLNSALARMNRKRWQTVWFSALGGSKLTASGSLRRFATPEMTELLGAVAWCSLVGVVAANWPGFAYPIFAQTAWTALVYNSTLLPFVSRAAPLLSSNASFPPSFATQMADPTSPIYLNATLPSVLLDLEGERNGMEKWARAAGVRHHDLFSICGFTFLALCAGMVVLHAIFFVGEKAVRSVQALASTGSKPKPTSITVDAKSGSPSMRKDGSSDFARSQRNSAYGASVGGNGEDEVIEALNAEDDVDDGYMNAYATAGGFSSSFGSTAAVSNLAATAPAWRLHLASLAGNLVRLLLLFHLPLTTFAIYQLTLKDEAPTATFVLAILALAGPGLLVPAYLLFELHRTPVSILYSNLESVLALGPLYNLYAEECCMFSGVRFAGNVVLAAVMGGLQTSGIGQAAGILLVEVATTLVTSLWLPWGDNANMGAMAFSLCVARIIVAVLLVVLSPTVNVSPEAVGWMAYVVFFFQVVILLLLFGVLAAKTLELPIRLFGGASFDESRSRRAGGLLGAVRRADRRGRKKGERGVRKARATAARKEKAQQRDRPQLQHASESSVGTRTHLMRGKSPSGMGARRPSSSMSVVSADDDGFIMSAMSTGPWVNSGYVQPGAYSSQPGHRSSQSWGTSAPPPATSGFARVGGGRATSSNPYQMEPSYPPQPSSSADYYSNVARPPATTSKPATGRGEGLQLPQGAQLLSNSVSRYSPDVVAPASSEPRKRPRANRGGFFGRFKRAPRRQDSGAWTDDTFSDDSSDEEATVPAGGKRRLWPFKLGAQANNAREDGSAGAEDEDEPSSPPLGERSFQVVRKPRPRPSPHHTTTGSSSNVTPPATSSAPPTLPHVAIQGPSRPTSILDDLDQAAGIAR